LQLLTTYYAKRWGTDLLQRARIWEAVRATSAATTFFDPLQIGAESFVDGATSANNPVNELWIEAYNKWREDSRWRLEENLACLVSIGTGEPSVEPFGKDPMQVGATLLKIATDTRGAAETFQRAHDYLFRDHYAFRFNVIQGLEKIGLEDAKRQGEISAATKRYVAIQNTQESLELCAGRLKSRESMSQYL
jgi:Patatin-like phospholipase